MYACSTHCGIRCTTDVKLVRQLPFEFYMQRPGLHLKRWNRRLRIQSKAPAADLVWIKSCSILYCHFVCVQLLLHKTRLHTWLHKACFLQQGENKIFLNLHLCVQVVQVGQVGRVGQENKWLVGNPAVEIIIPQIYSEEATITKDFPWKITNLIQRSRHRARLANFHFLAKDF